MKRTATLLILAWGSSVLAAEVPIDSTISYQGRLTDGGDPAEGEYDMRFSLFDAPAGGNQVGPTLVFDGRNNNLDPVDVMGGLFQVGLTFGDGVFLGDALWLEIEVRPHENGQYVMLEPRQPLTAVPYALYALDGPGGDGGFWSARGSHIFNTNSGNVGIGTTTPIQPLDVHGIVAATNPGSSPLGSVIALGSPTTNIGITMVRGDGEGGQVRRWDYLIASDSSLRFQDRTFGRDRLVIDTSGNVGVGTTSPIARLEVAGGILSSGPNGGDVSAKNPNNQTAGVGLGWHNDVARIRIGGDGPGAAGGLDIQKTGDRSLLRILHNGNVGIGTTEPITKLHVAGDGYVTGGLGIGTTAGNTKLSVFGSGDGAVMRLGNGSSAGTLLVADSGVGPGKAASFYGITPDPLVLVHNDGTGPALKVIGTATVDVLEITGADLAERFPVSEEVGPGMVMEIDPTMPGKLRLSRGAYNRRVAGVASGAGDIPTGAILGNLPGHGDAPPVALSGRVWVYCDASETAIELGDLLTTSATPGHAMAVRDFTRSPGATLGKAMTSLDMGETGLVLVLVNLQ